jgi:hypothetical protein
MGNLDESTVITVYIHKFFGLPSQEEHHFCIRQMIPQPTIFHNDPLNALGVDCDG